MKWFHNPRTGGALERSDGWEVIRQPLYDTVEMPDGSVREKTQPPLGRLEFFTAPLGFPWKSGVNGKTFLETNMFMANMLPPGQEFEIDGIAVIFQPGRSAAWSDELLHFYLEAHFFFQIGAKQYLRAPVIELLPWYYSDMLAAMNYGSYEGLCERLEDKHVVQYARTFKLDKPLKLIEQQNFLALIEHPGFPTWPQRSAHRKVRVILEGLMYRRVA